jgi:cytochrome c biogenesis protein CcmG/thiol:disulfide interchange protein DsbE
MAGASLLVASLCFSCTGNVPVPEIGKPIPEFTLPDLEGNTFRLSETRGSVVLVNFWATWCPPCVDEMPSLEKLYQTLEGKGLQVVAVSVDDDLEVIERFREEHGLTFTILHDEGAKVANRFQTYKFPETYVVDRQGRLVWKIIGPRDWIAPNPMLDIVGLLKSGNPSAQLRR